MTDDTYVCTCGCSRFVETKVYSFHKGEGVFISTGMPVINKLCRDTIYTCEQCGSRFEDVVVITPRHIETRMMYCEEK